MFKSIVGPILALLGASVVLAASLYFVYHKGVYDGVDSFHKACYNSSSPLFVQDDETKETIVCAPWGLDKQPNL